MSARDRLRGAGHEPNGRPRHRVVARRLEFLQADNVRLLTFEPLDEVQQTRANSVDVESGDPEHVGLPSVVSNFRYLPRPIALFPRW
jgi:hypothetical protein